MHWPNTVNHFDCLQSDVEKNVGNSLSLLAHWFCFIILCRCWQLDRSVIPLRTKIILCFSEIKVNLLNLLTLLISIGQKHNTWNACWIYCSKAEKNWLGFFVRFKLTHDHRVKTDANILERLWGEVWHMNRKGDLACVDEETLTNKYESDLRKYGKLLKL